MSLKKQRLRRVQHSATTVVVNFDQTEHLLGEGTFLKTPKEQRSEAKHGPKGWEASPFDVGTELDIPVGSILPR